MSNLDGPQTAKPLRSTRYLLAAIFWFGCSFAVWRLPWPASILATASVLSLSTVFASIGVGALVGSALKGLYCGLGIAVVVLSIWLFFDFVLMHFFV